MAYISEEIANFTYEKKTARFRLVLSGEVYTDNNEMETEKVGAEISYILEEIKGDFSLRIVSKEQDHNVPLVIDRISGSVVIFFRVQTRFKWDERVYINITYGWFGRWKSVSFADANNRKYFGQKL